MKYVKIIFQVLLGAFMTYAGFGHLTIAPHPSFLPAGTHFPSPLVGERMAATQRMVAMVQKPQS